MMFGAEELASMIAVARLCSSMVAYSDFVGEISALALPSIAVLMA